MAKQQTENDTQFDGLQEVKSSWIKWGKVGDWFKGTLVDKRQTKSTMPGKENELVWVYEFKTQGGAFHQLDDKKNPIEPAVVISEGEFWTLGGKAGIDNQMRNVRLGQIVGMRFTEEKPAKTKGFNPLKVIKVYAGAMDENYSGETSQDVQTPF